MRDDDSNPYVGLRPFEREDSLQFFGRREQTAELLDRLHESHFLGVVGSSGCGKSSLIRAGLVPALLGGFLVEARDRWRISVMKPGDSPLRNLASAVLAARAPDNATDTAPDDEAVDTLRDALSQEHTQGLVDHIAPTLGSDGNLLLLVDQFEEIFAFRGHDDEAQLAELPAEQRRARGGRRNEAAAFVDMLIGLSTDATLPVYVVLTMRTDFLGDCDLFYGLPEAMNRGRYLVPRLSRQQLRQAIAGPARLSGTTLAPRLLDRVLNQLGDRTDRLPVLQHALSRTWEEWNKEAGDGSIDLSHYDKAGGLENALSWHAAKALDECDPEAAARIFKCLTDTDVSQRRVRRPVPLSTLVAETGLPEREVTAVLDRFAAPGRHFIVRSPGSVPGDPRVDISHESLIRQWDTLRGWVDEERAGRDRFETLVTATRDWEQNRASLLRGPELLLHRQWRAAMRPTAAWAARYSQHEHDYDDAIRYLDESWTTAQAEADRQRRNARIIAAVGSAAVLLLVVAGVALYSYLRANQETATARARVNRTLLAMSSNSADALLGVLLLLELRDTPESPQGVSVASRLAQGAFPAAVMRGDGGTVYAAEFSPDGTRVLAAGDGTARIWRADGRGDPVVLSEPQEEITHAAFSPTGARVVTAGGDAVRVWPADGGASVWIGDHRPGIAKLAYSPDGTRVVTVALDRTVRVWRVEDRPDADSRVVRTGHTEAVLSVAFSPNGNRIVSGSRDDTARVWSADGLDAPVVLRGHQDAVNSAAFSPDGARVVTASWDGTARVWLADGGGDPVVLIGHRAAVNSAAFNHDGTRVVTASDDGTARIWSADGTSRFPEVLAGHSGSVFSAAFSRDGTRVVTAGRDGTARVWPADGRGEPVILAGPAGDLWSAAFSPDGTRVVTAAEDGAVRVWPTHGEAVVLRGHETAVHNARFSPDGTRVVTAGWDQTARLWRADGDPLVVLPHGNNVNTVEFSPDGTRVVTAAWDGTAQLWSVDGSLQQVLAANPGQDGAAISPDGSRLVTASQDGTARIWSTTAAGDPLAVLEGHEDRVHDAAFNHDGTRVVTASDDGTARIWSAGGGDALVVLDGHQDAVVRIAFSPDGGRVVTGSKDHTARVWSTVEGTSLALLEGHEDTVTGVAFSPDGTRVVTSSDDGRARIWAADGTGAPVVLLGHQGQVRSAVFGPDGNRLLTASQDGTAQIRRVDWESLLSYLRDATTACLTTDDRQSLLGEPPDEAQATYDACERRYDRTPAP